MFIEFLENNGKENFENCNNELQKDNNNFNIIRIWPVFVNTSIWDQWKFIIYQRSRIVKTIMIIFNNINIQVLHNNKICKI